MAYATLQDLIDRFGEAELTYHTDKADPPAGEPDQVLVARALADAEAIVDRHLAGRYALPLSAVDPSLTKIACDLARYFIQGDAVEKDGVVDRNHRAALQALRDIADGRTRLQLAGVEPAVAAGGPKATGAARVFSACGLKDFLG